MLVVKQTLESGIEHVSAWHVGETLPKIQGAVVTFQADGHELFFLLAVLRKHEARSYQYAVGGEEL